MIEKKEFINELVKNSIVRIFNSINDCVIIINKEGTVVFVNNAYLRQVGTTKERVLGCNLYNKCPDDRLLHVLRTGQILKANEDYDDTLGFRVSGCTLPLKDAHGETAGVIGLGTTDSIYKLNMRLCPIPSARHQKRKNLQPNREKLHGSFDKIIGEDPKLIHCLNLVANVAKTEATVMIRGETGTGKELIARAIHEISNRSKFPFVEINCAAIPENLLESELFGYDKGAFTGARHSGKPGKFEMAQYGTLFLDEIGDISLSTQVKLLRFMQEKYIERIGANKKIPINVRIIVATNRNLEQMVQQGEFREDLYYRLNVVPIFIPPLRERNGDILILAYYYLDYFCKQYEKNLSLSPQAVERLQDHYWPGNVRELRNVIENAVIMCQENIITPDYLNIKNSSQKLQFNTLSLKRELENLEKEIIKKALEVAGNNKSKAIKYLGISSRTFYTKLKKYRIDDKINKHSTGHMGV